MTTPRAYYNEIDKFSAEWLRQLINAKVIADGDVDERDIRDVVPNDLKGYTQCHFFAGIGGWSYALRLAGWPDDRPVWTGSCPCQSFSEAGTRKGIADERHLWPSWFHLVRVRKPSVVFGEQVEAAIRHGWLQLVQADMEGEGYKFRAVGLPAACSGAPHPRARLYFGATQGPLEHSHDAGVERLGGSVGKFRAEGREDKKRYGSETGFWDEDRWTWGRCWDGKDRPVDHKSFPMAHGVSGRMGKLRGYGNAIVPQVARIFIEEFMQSSFGH